MNSSLFKINVSNLDQFDANLLRFKEINNKITRSGCVKLVSAILYKVIILHEKPTLQPTEECEKNVASEEVNPRNE